MTIEADLRSLLLGDGDVFALVEDRIRPDELEQGDVLPAIYVTVDDEKPMQTLGGASELVVATILVGCVAKRKSKAREVATACRMRLEGYTGPAGEAEKVDITFDQAKTERFQVDEGSADGVYVTEQSYTVIYRHNTAIAE